MEVQLVAGDKDATEKITLSDKIFACNFNPGLVHQVVTAYHAAERAGTKAQKTRAEVSGGGIKPWRQKGTGRARAGTIRSPIWRKGGITFAAKPRDFSQKVNKKMYRAALCSILSELLRQQRLFIVKELTVNSPKTKEFVEILKKLALQKALIIVPQYEENLYLAARNIPHVNLQTTAAINPVDLIGCDRVLITMPAVQQLEGWLK